MSRSHVGLGIVWLLTAGCAPTFQDARMAPPGHVEVTPSFSGAGATSGGHSEYLINAFAVQGQAGIHDRFSLGAAYGRFENRDFDGGINAFAFGPKFGVVKDRFAVSVPFSFLFGDRVPISETWEVHPTALFTVPMSGRVDFNPSARLLVPLCDGCGFGDTLLGVNAGFGLRTGSRLTLRPEAGVLFNPGEGGVVWTFGFGVSVRNRERTPSTPRLAEGGPWR